VKSAFVIGYKNHAKKIINILKKEKLKIAIYHYDKEKTQIERFSEVLNYDFVFILSPNHTHFNYLNLLENIGYKKPIFCEKPLVNSKTDLKKISKFKIRNQIFTNFGLVNSKFFNIIRRYSSQSKIGELLKVDFISSHSFGFTKDYFKNWRSNGNINKYGILETVSIHFIYFFFKLLGDFSSISNTKKNFIKKSNAYDFANTNIILKNKSQINLAVSYVSPFIFSINMLFSEGFINISDNFIKVYKINLKKTKSKRSRSPKLIYKKSFNIKDAWAESHYNNVNYFLTKKSNFRKDFIESLYIHNNLFL
tara:strand:+ start:2647 stop:3570 length:924 start_codon:yes stop_codon:yes gene_type:complete